MSERAIRFPNFCQAHLSMAGIPYRGSPAFTVTSNLLWNLNLVVSIVYVYGYMCIGLNTVLSYVAGTDCTCVQEVRTPTP